MIILVLFTHRWRAGKAGGAETHVSHLMRGLVQRGHRIVFVTGAADEKVPCSESVLAHYELPFQTLNPIDKIGAYRRLNEIVARHAPALIHAHHRTGGYYAEAICRKQGVPYVVTVHDPWRSAPLKRFHGRAFRRMIAVSEFIRRGIIRQFRISPVKIRTIHNGVDPRRFERVAAADVSAFRQQYGIGSNEVVLSLVGRVSRVKGHYDLVNALRRLPAGLNYRCLIVGEGKERTELERLAQASHLGQRVTFCGYRSDIPVVMAGSDVVLLPSYREPFGLTIVESMLSHTAVLAARTGGIPEIVTHGYDGLLFEAGDLAGLAKSVAELVSDKRLRLRLAAEGYKTAVRRFLLPAMIDATEQYYGEIVGKVATRTENP